MNARQPSSQAGLQAIIHRVELQVADAEPVDEADATPATCTCVADTPVLPVDDRTHPTGTHPCARVEGHDGVHLCVVCGAHWQPGPWDDEPPLPEWAPTPEFANAWAEDGTRSIERYVDTEHTTLVVFARQSKDGTLSGPKLDVLTSSAPLVSAAEIRAFAKNLEWVANILDSAAPIAGSES